MKGKKVLALITLISVVSSFALTGCGSKKDSEVSTGTNKNVTLKYWQEFSVNASAGMKSMNENAAYKEVEKKTGVHIEFIHPAEGQAQEQFNLLINNKELPDIIQDYAGGYPGGYDKAIEDGVYLKLNDYIDKYAPNYKKLRESNKEIAKQTITDAGNIYAFSCIQNVVEPAWWGPVIRKDWLDELGLKTPTTMDEWYTVLKAFKEKKNVEAPLSFPKSGYDINGTFVSAYDIGPGFYKKDDKVKFGFIEPGFKEYLTEMNKWYKEGLIDKDFATRDRKSKEAMYTSGKAGAYMAAYGNVDMYAASLKANDPKGQFGAAVYPSLKAGETVHYRNNNTYNKGYDAVITSSSKNPVEAVKWFDYGYSEEGAMLFNYGIKDVSYKMVNGKPEFTELLTKNPSGLSFWAEGDQYKVAIGPYLRDYAAVPPFSNEAKDGMEQWTKAKDDYVMPSVTLTAAESEKYSSIMSEVDTYKNEKILKFIIGAEPISNFDNYVKEIKKMNIDEAIKIQQAALDRYNKR